MGTKIEPPIVVTGCRTRSGGRIETDGAWASGKMAKLGREKVYKWGEKTQTSPRGSKKS